MKDANEFLLTMAFIPTYLMISFAMSDHLNPMANSINGSVVFISIFFAIMNISNVATVKDVLKLLEFIKW